MDAFYVAVETILDPTLKGKPIIVGGDGLRGVVASCSYEARAYGIRSAMPSTRAKQLCPHAIFIRGNHGLYAEYSRKFHEIFREFTPLIEPIALDEAFLDLSGGRRLFGSGSKAASTIRERIFDELALTCSVGVATSKLLAKLASKVAKPPIGGGDIKSVPGARRPGPGVITVPPGSELAFLHPLPVRALWGVGPKTFEQLNRFGVETVGDLAAVPLPTLVGALGSAAGNHLHALAQAIDSRPIEAERAAKSIGHEETYSQDFHDTDAISTELLRIADAVASRTRAAGVRGRTVQLKVKLSDFRLLTRSKTFADPIDTAAIIHFTAVALLTVPDVQAEIERLGARLVGISMANLVEVTSEQLSIFDMVPGSEANSHDSWRSERPADRALAGTVEAIRAKFGAVSVGPASLAHKGKLRIKQVGDTQWGPVADGDLESTTKA
jgi:DNA polymerase IV